MQIIFFVFITVNIHFVESLFSHFHRPPSTPLEPQLEIPWSLLKLYQGTGWCNRISNILRNSSELKSRNLPLKAVSMSQSSLKNRAAQGGWCFSMISSSQWNRNAALVMKTLAYFYVYTYIFILLHDSTIFSVTFISNSPRTSGMSKHFSPQHVNILFACE